MTCVTHDNIDVRIDATDRPVDLPHEDVNVAIRSPRSHPELHSEVLFDEEVFPVRSPGLLEEEHPLRDPPDLHWHALLHVDWKYPTDSWVDWARSGSRWRAPNRSIHAPGSVFVADDPAAGRLIKPFSIGVPVGCTYCLLCPPATAHNPKIEVFRSWLTEEAHATRPGTQHQDNR